jgi:serine protease Do
MRVSSFLMVSVVAVALAGCGGATVVVEDNLVANDLPLVIGGSASNFGSVDLAAGFLPDPHSVPVVSGATATDAVDLSSLGLSPMNSGACRGFATSSPDYIVRFTPGNHLRIYVEAPGDTTLVVNDGQGNWWCSDDDGGNLNPSIEIPNPVGGQYDIWVGSYQAGANIRGTLHVSEFPAN